MRCGRSAQWAGLLVTLLSTLGCGETPTPAVAPPTASGRDGPVQRTSTDGLDASLSRFSIPYYLRLAGKLQASTVAERVRYLQGLTADPQRESEVWPLCRMLFRAKGGGELDPPALGLPFFIGDGDELDISRYGHAKSWPLAPITLRDGLPIMVTKIYLLSGLAEPPAVYLGYCLNKGEWREQRYIERDTASIRAAIRGFVNDFGTHPALTESEVRELLKQADYFEPPSNTRTTAPATSPGTPPPDHG